MTQLDTLTWERTAGGNRLGTFTETDQDDRLVTIASGPYEERLPLARMTVGNVRRRFGDRFDIGPQAVAVLDGHDVRDDAVIHTGQLLMFSHRAGEKG